jgi:hypothetical protein
MLNQNDPNTDVTQPSWADNGEHKLPDPLTAIAELKAQVQALEKQITLARGTRDVQGPKPPAPKAELGVRLEQVLRTKACTTEELAKLVGEPFDKVKTRLKELRKHLADVGTAEQAKWVWRIGDDTPSKDLRDLIERLISGHKMTTAQLTTITGARMSRVNGALVDLQRDPSVPIYNLGTDFRAEWLIVPKNAKPANLPPKAPKR